MPLLKRRSSFLGQPTATERSVGACSRAAPRDVMVGMPQTGGSSSLSTRISRRALGISSVFLQGLRSSAVPILPQTGGSAHYGGSPGLNGCLMEYRDKVRALEQLNLQLETQIRHCLDRRASCAGAWGPLRQDWENTYRQVSEAILDNARIMLQTENVQAKAEDIKERYEIEQPFKRALEEEISSLYKVIDDANFTQADLESHMETVRADLRNPELTHEEDVRELYNQMEGCKVDEPDAPVETSLHHMLAYIRCHWETVVGKNRAETDAYLEHKAADCMKSKLSCEEEELETLKTECNDAGCKIQSLQTETESVRALKRGLENTLKDSKHWHEIELQNLGSVIEKLESELGDVRVDTHQQYCDYDTLRRNKMRLEQEIGIYHGILDGEERRYQLSMHSNQLAAPEGTTTPSSHHEEETARTE